MSIENDFLYTCQSTSFPITCSSSVTMGEQEVRFNHTLRISQNVSDGQECSNSRSLLAFQKQECLGLSREMQNRKWSKLSHKQRNRTSKFKFRDRILFFLIRLRLPRFRGPKSRFSATRYRKAMGFKMYEPHRTKRYFIQKPERRQERVTRY